MAKYQNKVGRPILSNKKKTLRKEQLLQKIEPYLKSGLSVNKAIYEAKIYNSELYKYMQEDTEFRDRINKFRNFTIVMLNNSFFRELMQIIERQRKGDMLSNEDRKFLWKLIKINKITRQEWGRKEALDYDPEQELVKIMNYNS